MGCTFTVGDVPDYSSAAQGIINTAQTVANSLIVSTVAALNTITNAVDEDPPALEVPVFSDTPVELPELPSAPNVDIPISGVPVEPAEPTLGVVALPVFPAMPDSDIVVPTMDFPEKPNPIAAVAPGFPSDLSAVVLPVSPDLDFPESPSLVSLTVPDIPAIDLPVFSAALGDIDAAPDTAFSWNEVSYSSTLLTAVRDALLGWVSGAATGLSEDVEQALWNRGRDRDNALYVSAFEQINRDFASRGHHLPSGQAAQLAQEAIFKARESAGALNRDITIKQAELEQSNRHFAIQQSAQIESSLIAYWSQQQERSFEAAKYVIEAAVAIFQAKVTKYNADVEAFKARAEVYRTRIQGELAKIEIYKAQVEGQKLLLGVSEQQVNIYRAQLDSVKSLVAIYEAQVGAAKVIAETNKTRIEGFKAEVEAYAENVKAKASEYSAYESGIRAEVAKLEEPKVKADVLKTRVDAFSAQVKALTDAKRLEYDIDVQAPLDAYRASVAVFEAKIRSFGEVIGAYSAKAQAEAAVYSAEVGGITKIAEAESRIHDSTQQFNRDLAQIAIETGKVNLSGFTENIRLKIEAGQAVARTMAQLAAGAMAGVNVGVSLGNSGTTSRSMSSSSNCAETYSESKTTIKQG